MSTLDRNAIHAEPNGLPSPELFRQSGGGLRYKIDRLGAITGFAGSAVAFVFGTVFLTAGYFMSAEQALPFNTIGTVLLVSVIPLVLAGAAFLDRLEDDLDTAEAHAAAHAPTANTTEAASVRLSARARGGVQCST
jgi:hypothetical protein